MRVAIIDYGSGNLKSVAKAFERASLECDQSMMIDVTNDAQSVLNADYIVLPGVGAYADCRHGLDRIENLQQALIEVVLEKGRPFLGICVGMQLLSTYGHEKTITKGLGWIDGEVVPMQPADPALKIPQIGWNSLTLNRSHPVFENIPTGTTGLHAYFVHSYMFNVKNPAHQLATTDYGGPVTAAVARDNIVGTQFHPEKSQTLGLSLIANFLKWKP